MKFPMMIGLAACQQSPPAPPADTLDSIARDYVRLSDQAMQLRHQLRTRPGLGPRHRLARRGDAGGAVEADGAIAQRADAAQRSQKLKFLGQLPHALEQVADQDDVGDLENCRVLVLVDVVALMEMR